MQRNTNLTNTQSKTSSRKKP